ncbi:MAG: hypothetical protein PF572_01055 [Patescibacteria group bacterium]|jgi:hypothetical protein|nr:hypothetical protein [Patescibacteria group bacterium]
MKFKLKKYIYVINDLTNILLKKDIENSQYKIGELHKSLKIVSIFLAISVIVNIILLIKVFIYG